MVSPLLPVVLLLGVAMAGCSGGSAGLEDIQVPGGPWFDESRGAIQGTVTDEALLPVLGAVVSLGGAESTMTGSDGEFRFNLLQPGPYDLVATAPGYG
ncbi:MAG TPA: carboxypeptidase-like regulatory domain-containing protein, partial [Candidatus Thermoplasmatota archaeon]